MVYLTDYRGNSPYMYHKNHTEKYQVNRAERPKENKHHNVGNHNVRNHGREENHKR